ncbi:hypothetical protein [Streptomyces sp. NPDC029554]|uniref:hypothetical protein n=1 Tax=Streptomyces sp. NPDC029554 TaxID=3155126 RepID=UPI0033DBD10E
MGALLALSSAVVHGIVVPRALSASLWQGGAPITGGLLSRRTHHTAVTFLGRRAAVPGRPHPQVAE